MITEKELRDRLTACVETSPTIKPQDMPLACKVVQRLMPMVLRMIREEVRAAKLLAMVEEE